MTLVDEARGILNDAEALFESVDGPAAEAIRAARHRLDEPLRVAIAGKVKAGKSTLLNALVGDLLAPTDTGECTRIVTWYRNGTTYQVMLHPKDGSDAMPVKFSRQDGALEVRLGDVAAEDVAKLDIAWPAAGLRALTLIDTPGIGSLNAEVGERTFEFLDPEEHDTPADAVLYLMKHIHSSDLRLLEAFHDDTVSTPNPVNAVAVLSRADEIGGGRLDSMASARRIAQRYGDDRRLRSLAQLVTPVAGLLAETAGTLTEREYRALHQLAEAPVDMVDGALLSADRFVDAGPQMPLTSIERRELLARFGVFGIRISLALLRRAVVTSSAELAEELTERSGLTQLRTVLTSLFVDRADVLKTRSALLAVERTCAEHPDEPGAAALVARVEQVMAGAHPFNELSTLAALRSGWVPGDTNELRALERVLGSGGTAAWQRLAAPEAATVEELRALALDELTRWQQLAENPFSGHDLSSAARVAVRSVEALFDGWAKA